MLYEVYSAIKTHSTILFAKKREHIFMPTSTMESEGSMSDQTLSDFKKSRKYEERFTEGSYYIHETQVVTLSTT